MAHAIPGLKCTFFPQYWRNDLLYCGQPQGVDTWYVDLFEVYRLTGHAMTHDGYPELDDDPYQRDELRHAASAPQWVKDWSGPFEVEWEVVDSVPAPSENNRAEKSLKLYSIDVNIVATAYVKATDPGDAANKVRDLNMTGIEIEASGGLVDGRTYAALMADESVEVTLSPAMTIGGQACSLIELAYVPETTFDPELVTIERKRFSVTQGEVLVSYDGKKIAQFGDDIRLGENGEWETLPDSHWIEVARQHVAEG